MSSLVKHLVLSLTLASVLAAPFAEAKRLGGGRSSGMQRSAPTQNYSANKPMAPAPAAAPSPAAPARTGPGVGTAVAAGVAGAAAGYMLGSAMSDNKGGNAAAGEKPATAAAGQQENKTPWGTILLLLAVLGLGLMWFKRRNAAMNTAPRMATPMGPMNSMDSTAQQDSMTRFSIPPIGGVSSNMGAMGGESSVLNNGRLPDGTEVPHFLRQAKATFLHVQSMNNPQNVEEIRKYLTPELYVSLQADITGNDEPADFPTLNCELITASEEAGQLVASVRFSGMVSESVNAPLEPFSEIWHYIKSVATEQKWVVAGIQQ